MRWKGGRRSNNIEDRRGQGGSRPGGRKMKTGGLGFFIILALMFFFGGGKGLLNDFLGGGNVGVPAQNTQVNTSQRPSGATDEMKEFISVVLGTTEDIWGKVFQQAGLRYQPPKLVLFDGYVRSACGMTSAATGPFYCPGDSKVYIDTSFFRELSRMGANGDFAQAYVIGHEVAHHVQNQQGISMKVQRMQRQSSKSVSNKLSVLTELQADCYAGVWAHHTEKRFRMLEQGDIEEAINAAASIGDDRMQKRAGQWVNPDSFTHGSSKQRVEWFQKGILTGDAGKCDTFSRYGL